MVYFKHQYTTMPTYTKADAIMAAAQDLLNVLTQDATSNIGQNDKEKLIELMNIFNKATKKHNYQQPNKTKGGNYTQKTTNHCPTTTPIPGTAQHDNNKGCTYYRLNKRNTKHCYMPQQTSLS